MNIYFFTADVSATPFGLGSLGGLGGLEALGLGSANFMELQQRMQRELLTNPDMLRQVMDNPLVQQLMNDPNNMRQLILSNPQMQELIEVTIFLYSVVVIFHIYLHVCLFY